MNADAQSAHDDLAYLKYWWVRMKTRPRAPWARAISPAASSMAARCCCTQRKGLDGFRNPRSLAYSLAWGPTVLFIPVITWIILRNRAKQPSGIVGRSIGAVFGIAGVANLFLILVIGAVAWREHSLPTWLIYPCCVFVLQGGAWLFAYAMRRRGLVPVDRGRMVRLCDRHGAVRHVDGLLHSFCGPRPWGCLALPGWIMMRHASQTG